MRKKKRTVKWLQRQHDFPNKLHIDTASIWFVSRIHLHPSALIKTIHPPPSSHLPMKNTHQSVYQHTNKVFSYPLASFSFSRCISYEYIYLLLHSTKPIHFSLLSLPFHFSDFDKKTKPMKEIGDDYSVRISPNLRIHMSFISLNLDFTWPVV